MLVAAIVVLFYMMDERILLPALVHPVTVLSAAISGVLLAPAAVYADRIGASPFAWARWSNRAPVLSSRPEFESAEAAQEWLEYREGRCIFPYLVWGIALVVTSVMIVLLAGELPLRESIFLYYSGYGSLLNATAIFVGALFAAALTGAAIGLEQHRQDRSGLAAFVFVRPATARAFARSHFRTLAKALFTAFFGAAVICWVGFTVANHILAAWYGDTGVAFLGSESLVHMIERLGSGSMYSPFVQEPVSLWLHVLWGLYATFLLWILLHIGNRYVFGGTVIYLLPIAVQMSLFPYAPSNRAFAELWLWIATAFMGVATVGLYLRAIRNGLVNKAPVVLIVLSGLAVFLLPSRLDLYAPLIQRMGGLQNVLALGASLLLFVLLTLVAVPLEALRRRQGGGLL